ncbi:MAG TPA: glycosyltransferase family 4 protein [Pelobium sp.]|nr:glycosyltransferase family 4 protein [Pelobium sp.]
MKVLHIAEKADGGGAESVFRETVQVFKKYDQKRKHYVACRYSEKLPFVVDFAFTEKKENIFSKIYSNSNKKELARFLSDLEPEIIHLQHYANLSPSILHALYNYKRKNKKTTIIQTVHTFEYACSHHAAYDYKQNKRCLDCASQTFKTKIFYRNCSRLGFAHSFGKGLASLLSHYFYNKQFIDKLIVPSEFMRTAVGLNKSRDMRKVIVVNNPIADELFEANPTEKKNQILYFGRLSEEKNIDLLLRGYSHYQKSVNLAFPLVIIGEGSEKERLISLSIELGCADYVTFMPFLSHFELKKYLEVSKISLLTSKCFENAPMMVIESLACDIIPIVCNHGGMLEMVECFGFGFHFNADDYLDLAKTIEDVTNNYNIIINRNKGLKDEVKRSLSSLYFFDKINNIYDLSAIS